MVLCLFIRLLHLAAPLAYLFFTPGGLCACGTSLFADILYIPYVSWELENPSVRKIGSEEHETVSRKKGRLEDDDGEVSWDVYQIHRRTGRELE